MKALSLLMNLPMLRFVLERTWLSNIAVPLTPALSPRRGCRRRSALSKRWFSDAMRALVRGDLTPALSHPMGEGALTITPCFSPWFWGRSVLLMLLIGAL